MILSMHVQAGQLEVLGIEPTEDPNEASVVIFNTCSIRDKAEQVIHVFNTTHVLLEADNTCSQHVLLGTRQNR